MAFASANSSAEPRAFSLGPLKLQLMTFTVTSGSSSGVITADALSSISHVVVDGGALVWTAAPTFSGNQVTLAFTDPVANRFGNIAIYGV